MARPQKLSRHEVVLSDGTRFEVPAGVTLLQAALDAGISWPNGCRVGLCGSCRCQVTAGTTDALTDFTGVLTADEIEAGHVLACRSFLRSDITVDNNHLVVGSDEEAAPIDATILQSERVSPLVQQLTVALDHPHTQGYNAGQYAQIEVPGVVSPRCFSFANACRGDGQLQFFIRLFPGGQLGEWLTTADRRNARIRISRPLGYFVLKRNTQPLLFFAGGTGLAPVLAMLEELVAQPEPPPPVRIVYAARDQRHLFHNAAIKSLQARWPDNTRFEFIPVLSREPGDSDWNGKRGYLFDHLRGFTKTFETADCYLCGPPGLVDATQLYLIKAGFAPERISADRFLPSMN